MCECSLIPPSKRISRCLPFASTASSRRPFSRAIAAGRASRTSWPASLRRNAAAVRQIVSPSGKDGVALRPEHHTFRRRAESGFVEHAFQMRALDRFTVDALDLQLSYTGGDPRERTKVGQLDVADREQRAPTTFQVQPQLATIEDDVGAGGAGHPRFLLRPRDVGPVRARRGGGGQRDDRRFLVARAAKPVYGARQG